MADYMHACPSCHTFYPPGVALGVRNGVCKCGAALFATDITPENFEKSGEAAALEHVFGIAPAQNPQSQKNTAPTVQKPAVKYRKKPVPEEYDVDPQQLPTSGCLAYFAILGVPTVAIFAFLQNELDLRYLVGGLCLSLFLFAVARISAHLANVVRHLGAIRWLMEHGDETEPVPAAQPTPPKKKIDSGFWGVAAVLLLVVALIAIYALTKG